MIARGRWVEGRVRRQPDHRPLAAERRDGVIEVVLAVEVRDVGPRSTWPPAPSPAPARDGGKNLSRLTPVCQVVRRPDRDARSRREEVVGIALLDDPRVGDARDLPRVVEDAGGGSRRAGQERWGSRPGGACPAPTRSRRSSSSSNLKVTAFERDPMGRWPSGESRGWERNIRSSPLSCPTGGPRGSLIFGLLSVILDAGST